VTGDRTEPEITAMLRALGQPEPPAPGALDAAREALWSAVAGEMLSLGPADDAGRTRAAGTDRQREDIRRQTGPGL
jgi:hypothetical protein